VTRCAVSSHHGKWEVICQRLGNREPSHLELNTQGKIYWGSNPRYDPEEERSRTFKNTFELSCSGCKPLTTLGFNVYSDDSRTRNASHDTPDIRSKIFWRMRNGKNHGLRQDDRPQRDYSWIFQSRNVVERRMQWQRDRILRRG